MEGERKYYVYLYFRSDGAPLYVGKGCGDRWRCHLKPNSGTTNIHFRCVVNQARTLGKDLPCVFLSEGLTEDEALMLEPLFIAAIGRELNGGPLVNQTDGGDGQKGRYFSAETRAKMRAARKNFRHTPETKAKISAALKGRSKTPEHIANATHPVSAETREKLSASKMGNKSRLGMKHSDETKEKMRSVQNSPAVKAKIRAALMRRTPTEKLMIIETPQEQRSLQ